MPSASRGAAIADSAGRRPKPPEEFPFPSIWDVLWKGLLLGHPELLHPDSPRPPPSPLLIRLEFREPLGHRPREPGLDTRNKALRRLVEKAVVGKEGLTKTEAIEKVGKECHLSFGTVRAAAYKKR